jgi:hypothetical protein
MLCSFRTNNRELQRLPLALLLLAAPLCATCASTDLTPQVCEPQSYKCVGSLSLRCSSDGAGWQVEADCSQKALTCTTRGCLTCQPGGVYCQGQDLMACNADGTGYDPKPLLTCDGSKGMVCEGSSCSNACQLSRVNRSYMGCEYWAVDLDNAVVEIGSAAAQQFAIALSNPSSLPASVTVSVNEAPFGQPPILKEVTKRSVAPEALEVILLPAREVDGSPAGEFNTGTHTALSANAYKIESTAPIIVYQFNPLSNVGVFSNDASLLIPTPALTTDSSNENGASYLVMGWPQTIAETQDRKTNFGENLRAFLTVVGTRDGTNVRVYLSTPIVGDGKTIPALAGGQTLDVKLNAFDVLNLETGSFNADFTGTKVTTDKPVVVFSGSEASDVPDFPDLSTRKCCADHIEEQLFPIQTLGTAFIAISTSGRTAALKEAGATITPHKETEYFRVLAAGESTAISTSLPPPFDNFLVAGGKHAQLRVEQDFTIQATGPLVVGQFMPSQDEAGVPSSLPGGDPSFIVLPPVEQFRKNYLFLTPDKYSFDFIAVAAPRGARVKLDGRELKEGKVSGPGPRLSCTRSPVGKVRRPGDKNETEYDAIKCQLSFPVVIPDQTPPQNLLPGEQNDGVHRLTADLPVGLVVYGFDAYVSYGYPGGTDLALINLK